MAFEKRLVPGRETADIPQFTWPETVSRAILKCLAYSIESHDLTCCISDLPEVPAVGVHLPAGDGFAGRPPGRGSDRISLALELHIPVGLQRSLESASLVLAK